MELPTTHRVPISWLTAHACGPIKLRAVRDVMPTGWASEEDVAGLEEEVAGFKTVTQIGKKQRADGTWGGKMLTPGGTIEQYRRLIELGVPEGDRSVQVANRLLFRILSRDPDPALNFEYKKDSKGDEGYAEWARGLLREAATAALVEAKQNRDPRVRGAAKRIIDTVVDYLRSDLADDPFIKVGSKTVLHPEAVPPTRYSVAMMANMPTLQRERAGFVERLTAYITQPYKKKAFWVQAGSKTVKSGDLILGNPLDADASGKPKDLPFALHWLELLARLGFLHSSESAVKVLARLLGDCDEEGVWSPKGLRSAPSGSTGFTDHMFPLEADSKTAERRRTDVTFRLSLIAKLAGLELDYI